MTPILRKNGALYVENVPLERIAAQLGTPCYVYSRAAIEQAWQEFAAGCAGRDVLICYAVKANSTLAILNLFARRGAGFDIVSGGELARVRAAGGSAEKTVFSGVGKSESEMRTALEAGIRCFNVESEEELYRLSNIASSAARRATVSLRVNPDVDPGTHPYIATGLRESKFGVDFGDAPRLYRIAAKLPGIRVAGIDCHIGSQLTDTGPFSAALDKLLSLADRLGAEGIHVEHLDLGGGLGIRYRNEEPPPIANYLQAMFSALGNRRLQLLLEPGRALVGNAGLLLTRIEYLKHGPARNFAVVDAAMNDLLRPALYESWHEIVPVHPSTAPLRQYDIVGPVCESSDFLGQERQLNVSQGDLLAVLSAGAYGMSMSSNYNSRPRPPEAIVDGDAVHVVRPRESLENLFASERILP